MISGFDATKPRLEDFLSPVPRAQMGGVGRYQ